MVQVITTSVNALLSAARENVRTFSAAEAVARHGGADTVFVDLRDPRELEREGRIPGAFHCPRGMLEFWIDPESPYHKVIFAQDKQFLFFCASGWLSLLAADMAQKMGLKPVGDIEGGFTGWKAAGGPISVTEKDGK